MDINTPLHGFVHLWIVWVIIVVGYMVVVTNKIFVLHNATKQRITNWILGTILMFYGAVFSYLCFFYRMPMSEAHYQFAPLWSYKEAFGDGGVARLGMARSIILNILITIPLGYFLPAVYRNLKHRYGLTILTVALISVITEIIQLISRTGLCETDDVINNTIGGVVGLVSYMAADKIIKKVQKH